MLAHRVESQGSRTEGETQRQTSGEQRIHREQVLRDSSPCTVQEEGCVRAYAGTCIMQMQFNHHNGVPYLLSSCYVLGTDGSCPFLPVSHDSYKEHTAPITHCKFSPNATQVASVDTDGRMRWVATCIYCCASACASVWFCVQSMGSDQTQHHGPH